MNIAIGLNRKYINYAIVMLTSFFINNNEHTDVYILHTELDSGDILYISSSLKKFDTDFISIKLESDDFVLNQLPVSDAWSKEVYYRLFILDKIKNDIDRILYLDIDIIVHAPIDDLYYEDFENNEIIATWDSNGTTTLSNLPSKVQSMLRNKLVGENHYFNSGVMLLNISEMKNKYSFEAYLNAMKDWNYGMNAFDQDILNYVHLGKVKYVPWEKYDLFARLATHNGWDYKEKLEKNAIIHFAGLKPWEFNAIRYELEKIWWEYASITPIYQSLMEDFLDNALFSNKFESELRRLENEKKQLEQTLHQANNILNSALQKQK